MITDVSHATSRSSSQSVVHMLRSLALAVVQGEEVALARAYGHRDIESKPYWSYPLDACKFLG